MITKDERRMARFAQYAMVASEEALNDAGWLPKTDEDLEATVLTPACATPTPLTSTTGRLYGIRYW